MTAVGLIGCGGIAQDVVAALRASTGNGVRIVSTEAPRGRILDRQGRVLVDNRVSEVVTLARDSAGNTYIEVRNPWGRNTPGGQPYAWVNANTVLSQMADVVIATP